MAIITFPKAKALRVLEAAIKLNKPIHIVKDHGVYIMVFGGTPEDNIIEYGNGYDPERNDEWYEKAEAALGGDDFGEEYDDFSFFKKLIELQDKWKTLRCHVTKTQLKLSVK